MTINSKEHWEQVYRARAPETMSWYEVEPSTSLAMLERAGLDQRSEVIDVGGGTSALAKHLLRRLVRRVTVLDVARAAIEASRARLGDAAALVTWCEGDVLTTSFAPAAYDFWHDRAVFHFLTEAEDRAQYVAQLASALRPDGRVVMATFAEDGPSRCSGLEVVRYTPESLASALGPAFELREAIPESHRTPAGATQSFLYTRWARTSAPRSPGRIG